MSEMKEVGEVENEVLENLNKMRVRSQQIMLELGRMEVAKSGLIDEHNRLESMSSSLLKGEARRMGIPDGVQWQLTPDGKALIPE